MSWQPIETAPTRTPVLLVALPDAATGQLWPKYGVGMNIGWRGGVIVCDWPWTMQPSHWQPLPSPPDQRERSES